MTLSGRDADTALRSGSLLSLAPRQSPKAEPRPASRRAERPAPSPILAALARSRKPITETPQAPVPEEDAAPAETTVESVVTGESVVVEEEPNAEDVAAEEVPIDSAPEPAAAKAAPATASPETAHGLVARLRRQFTEGLPEGRAEARGASAVSGRAKPAAPSQRSTLEELRFHLSEFRTEILVRAAGRGKPSR